MSIDIKDITSYKNLSIEEQRLFNKKRRDEHRNKRKSNIAQNENTDNTSNVNINIDSIEETPKVSMFDRLTKKSSIKEEKEEKKPDKKRVEKTETLISNVLPLTFSSLIALNARKMMKEPYKDCAPTQEEINSILYPLFSYISRQIEITGKASQDAIDLGTALLSSITVGMRILMTYTDIKEGTNEQKNINREDTEYSRRNNKAENNNYSRNIATEIIKRDIQQSDSINGDGNNIDGDKELKSREAEMVSQLMRRDRQGRARMGIAP